LKINGNIVYSPPQCIKLKHNSTLDILGILHNSYFQIKHKTKIITREISVKVGRYGKERRDGTEWRNGLGSTSSG